MVLNTAAELAYVTEHFSDDSGFAVDDDDWSELNYYLNADIDMGTTYSWLPLGRETFRVTKFVGTFWGNGHTIRFKTWYDDDNTTKENQGLFSKIGSKGKVYDVNVLGKCRHLLRLEEQSRFLWYRTGRHCRQQLTYK